MVMSAVCIILGSKPVVKGADKDYWPASQALLGKGIKFLEQLNNFKETDFNIKYMNIVRKEFITLAEFNPKDIEVKDKSSAGFCKWVLAADRMEEEYRKMLPKKKMFEEAEASANKMREELNEKQAELKVYQDKVDALVAKKEESERRKRELEEDIRLTELRFERALILIDALKDEKDNWEEKLKFLKEKVPLMMGDSLLSAGVLIYLGPFSGSYRNNEITKWVELVKVNKINYSGNYSFEESFGDPMQIRKWNMCGLPNDSISKEKGLTIYKTKMVPLIIDPQTQANKWIKKIESDHNLVATRIDKPDFLSSLEKCLSYGTPILIESVPEDIDPLIYPVLMKQTFKEAGSQVCIKIADNIIDYHANFR